LPDGSQRVRRTGGVTYGRTPVRLERGRGLTL
jgi:hypothetical protein